VQSGFIECGGMFRRWSRRCSIQHSQFVRHVLQWKVLIPIELR